MTVRNPHWSPPLKELSPGTVNNSMIRRHWHLLLWAVIALDAGDIDDVGTPQALVGSGRGGSSSHQGIVEEEDGEEDIEGGGHRDELLEVA